MFEGIRAPSRVVGRRWVARGFEETDVGVCFAVPAGAVFVSGPADGAGLAIDIGS